LLLVSGVCRLLTCLLLLPIFRELRQVQPFAAREWVFRMARIRFPVGVRFDAEPLADEDRPPPASEPQTGQPVAPDLVLPTDGNREAQQAADASEG